MKSRHSFGTPAAQPGLQPYTDGRTDDVRRIAEFCHVLIAEWLPLMPLLPTGCGRTMCKPLAKVPQSALCHAWPPAHSSCTASNERVGCNKPRKYSPSLDVLPFEIYPFLKNTSYCSSSGNCRLITPESQLLVSCDLRQSIGAC